jgi:hypothetical protein
VTCVMSCGCDLLGIWIDILRKLKLGEIVDGYEELEFVNIIFLGIIYNIDMFLLKFYNFYLLIKSKFNKFQIF